MLKNFVYVTGYHVAFTAPVISWIEKFVINMKFLLRFAVSFLSLVVCFVFFFLGRRRWIALFLRFDLIFSVRSNWFGWLRWCFLRALSLVTSLFIFFRFRRAFTQNSLSLNLQHEIVKFSQRKWKKDILDLLSPNLVPTSNDFSDDKQHSHKENTEALSTRNVILLVTKIRTDIILYCRIEFRCKWASFHSARWSSLPISQINRPI